jgi:DNA-binding transcriptional regulator YiaG
VGRVKRHGARGRESSAVASFPVTHLRALRKKLNLIQEELGAVHLPLGTVCDWEQGAHRADKAMQVLLTVIAKDRRNRARSRKPASIGLRVRWRSGFGFNSVAQHALARFL